MALFIFFLGLLCLSCCNCNVYTGNSSFGDGPAPQTCPKGYYCPNGMACPCKDCRYPRSARCTPKQDCPRLDECYRQPGGCYLIRIGHAKLFNSSSNKTLLEHQFVIYRGFAYEFGKGYSTQVLDITDPKYKYDGGRHLNSNGITNEGTSCCTYEEVMIFVKRWSMKYHDYHPLCNNCQHFARCLRKYLKTSSCNQQKAVCTLNAELKAILLGEIDQILSNHATMCDE